ADDADDAARPAMHRIALAPQPERAQTARHLTRTQQTCRLSFEEKTGIGQRQNLARQRFLGRFAHIAGYGGAQTIALAYQEMAKRADQRQALAHGQTTPGRLSGSRLDELIVEKRQQRGRYHGDVTSRKSPAVAGTGRTRPHGHTRSTPRSGMDTLASIKLERAEKAGSSRLHLGRRRERTFAGWNGVGHACARVEQLGQFEPAGARH